MKTTDTEWMNWPPSPNVLSELFSGKHPRSDCENALPMDSSARIYVYSGRARIRK